MAAKQGLYQALAPVGLAALTATAAWFGIATANSEPTISYRNARLAPMKEILVPRHVRPKWCYDTSPEFVFIEGRTLFRGGVDGEIKKIAEFDRPGDNASLVCSTNGKTIFVLSAQHDRAYVFDDQIFGEYQLNSQAVSVHLRYGSLMSPDGSVFFIEPAKFLRGSDVLKTRRSIDLRTADVFWSAKYALLRAENNSFVVRNISDLKQVGIFRFPTNVVVDSIEECGSNSFLAVFTDAQDNRAAETFSMSEPRVRTPVARGEIIGTINASNANCVLSVAKADARDIYLMQKLLIIGQSPPLILDVSDQQYTSDIFAISKDAKFVASYQEPHQEKVTKGRVPGRIHTWQIVK
jgi:hypothetical protein